MRTLTINIIRQAYAYLISLPLLSILGVKQIFLTGFIMSLYFVFAYTIFDFVIFKKAKLYEWDFSIHSIKDKYIAMKKR